MKLNTILILTTILSTLFSCKDSEESIFRDKTHKDTIKQNIGGVLIREIYYTEDLHSWINEVKYYYKDKTGNTNIIGSGRYYAEELPKDEQLMKLDKWTVFKTSNDREKDALFVCNNDTKEWTEYEISPKKIEQTDLWKKQSIDTQQDNWDAVSKIEKIDKAGNIFVHYTYAKKNRIFSFITGERKIVYKINLKTGRPEMTLVTKI